METEKRGRTKRPHVVARRRRAVWWRKGKKPVVDEFRPTSSQNDVGRFVYRKVEGRCWAHKFNRANAGGAAALAANENIIEEIDNQVDHGSVPDTTKGGTAASDTAVGGTDDGINKGAGRGEHGHADPDVLTAAGTSEGGEERESDAERRQTEQAKQNSHQKGAAPDPAALSKASRQMLLWHRRLCHPGEAALLRFGKATKALSLDPHLVQRSLKALQKCDTCIECKMARLPFPSSAHRSEKQLQLVHVDLIGPVRSESPIKYMMVIVDDYSRKSWAMPLQNKASALSHLREWSTEQERQSEQLLKVLRTDGGSEFASRSAEEWAAAKGIVHQYTAPYSSLQNGVVERANRTLQERMRTILQASGASAVFWPLAFLAATYTLNRTPHKAIDYKLPEEQWSGKPADVSLLRVWGCVCWIKVHRSDGGKLRARAIRGMFVGYDHQHKAWLVWTPSNTTKKFQWSRDVVFDEDRTFWSVLLSEQVTGQAEPREPAEKDWLDLTGVEDSTETVTVMADLDLMESPSLDSSAAQSADAPSAEPQVPSHSPEGLAGDVYPELQSLLSIDDILASPLAAETPPFELDFQTSTPEPPTSAPPASPPVHVPSPPPVFVEDLPAPTVSERQLRAERRHIRRLAAMSATDTPPAVAMTTLAFTAKQLHNLRTSADGVLLEPQNRKEAMQRGDWVRWEQAEREQYDALIGMNAWEIVPLPKGVNLVGCRWVYKLKLDEDGNAARWKARLTAQGFSQRPDNDYGLTFAPVARLDAVRLFFSIAIHLRLLVHQMDVVTAYLNGRLHHTVYMKQPPGFHVGGPDHVCRLLVPLYGLKQAGYEWNARLHEALHANGFRRCKSERCVYVRASNGTVEFALILVYVDDLLICTRTQPSMDEIKAFINKAFKCTDSGTVKHFLGMRIDYRPTEGKVTFSQTAYIEALLERFGVGKAAGSITPLPPAIPDRTSKDLAPDPARVRAYAQQVGCIKWLAQTVRPDLMFAAGCLGRFQSNPSLEHEQLLKTTMRYIRRTKKHTLIYSRSRSTISPLLGFCDSDYAGDVQTRRSTTGFVYFAFGNPVTWTSRLQPSVALSTTEAEYMALCEGLREGLWLRSLLRELGLWNELPIPLFTDNDGCRSLAHNPDDHRRSKHIDTQYHRVRDAIEAGDLTVSRVGTHDNPSDVCTKVLPGIKMHYAREQLHLHQDGDEDE